MRSVKRAIPSTQSLQTFEKELQKDLRSIYKQAKPIVGQSKKESKPSSTARKHTAAIVGVALGDEGKGRFVDNAIASLLAKKQVKRVYVIRFQGGNNAGHTVEKKGVKLALHVIPSGVFYREATCIMDRGMIIHIEDLQAEVTYAEAHAPSLQKRLFLSDDAILCTDLERAEEQLNKVKEGLSKGGTGRGIGPSYAHHYDKTGLRIHDLLADDWEEKLTRHYERYAKEFNAFELDVKDITVPDFPTIVKSGKSAVRTVGDKKIFLKRMKQARTWLIDREMVVNTFLLHHRIANDETTAILFEGAQAAGLDSWIGTRPDVTASNTSVYGVREGTGFWRIEDVGKKIGVIKIPYTSSVGARRMPTHIGLPKDLAHLPADASNEEQWAAYIRVAAHEYGTTTGRPRDINHIDLPLLAYNAKMAGIDILAVTHADIARKSDSIKICTHYTDKKGAYVPYQPGLRYLTDVTPQYVTLPGWDGQMCQKATSPRTLPKACLQFLAFLQKRIGYPIVAATTGPDRKQFVAFPGYEV